MIIKIMIIEGFVFLETLRRLNSYHLYYNYSSFLESFVSNIQLRGVLPEGDKFTNLNFYSSFLNVDEATAITGGDR